MVWADDLPERKLRGDTAVLKVFVTLGKACYAHNRAHVGDTYNEQVFSVTQGTVLGVEVTMGSNILEFLGEGQ